MRYRSLCATAAVLCIGTAAATADVGPPPPQPPPPAGPQSAEIRGVTIANQYGYWRGRRWLVRITGCPAGAPTCATGCAVTGIDGRAERVGSVADVVAAEKAAANAPLELMLEACRSGRLILPSPAAK